MELITIVRCIAATITIADDTLMNGLPEPLIGDEKPVVANRDQNGGVRSSVGVIAVATIGIERSDCGADGEVGIVSYPLATPPLRGDRRARHLANVRHTMTGTHHRSHVPIVLRGDERQGSAFRLCFGGLRLGLRERRVGVDDDVAILHARHSGDQDQRQVFAMHARWQRRPDRTGWE